MAALALALTGALTALTGCGGDPPPDTSAALRATDVPTDPNALFGRDCDKLPDDPKNPASVAAMQRGSIGDLVEKHPQLTTLREAVKKADMLDAFDGKTGLTVLVPTNDAFDKVPALQLKFAMSSKSIITDIVKFHVIEKPLTPAQLNTAGPHQTLEGSEIRVRGFGEDLRLATQSGHVLCGNIRTKNATVYFIDTVLLPG